MRPTRLSLTPAMVVAPLFLGLCLIPAHAQAVVSVPTVATQPAGPDLSAQGHAEIKVQADVAYLTISVTSEARREAAAAQDNAARTTALISQIRAVPGMKIADADIQTTDYTAGRQFNTNGAVPVLIGYQVTNTVRVTLHDVRQASRLVDLAAGSGATRITGLTYGLADRQAAEGKALILAVTDARARAGVMAAAMGIVLGNPRSISDSAGSTFQGQDGTVQTFSTAGAIETPISPQEITVTADVTVDYNLAAK